MSTCLSVLVGFGEARLREIRRLLPQPLGKSPNRGPELPWRYLRNCADVRGAGVRGSYQIRGPQLIKGGWWGPFRRRRPRRILRQFRKCCHRHRGRREGPCHRCSASHVGCPTLVTLAGLRHFCRYPQLVKRNAPWLDRFAPQGLHSGRFKVRSVFCPLQTPLPGWFLHQCRNDDDSGREDDERQHNQKQ